MIYLKYCDVCNIYMIYLKYCDIFFIKHIIQNAKLILTHYLQAITTQAIMTQ